MILPTMDRKGRIVIPSDLRRKHNIKPGDFIKIKVENYMLKIIRFVEGEE